MSNSTVRTYEDLDASIYDSTEESESLDELESNVANAVSVPISNPIQVVGSLAESLGNTAFHAIDSADKEAAQRNEMGNNVINNLAELSKRDDLSPEVVMHLADKQVEVLQMTDAANAERRKDLKSIVKYVGVFFLCAFLGGAGAAAYVKVNEAKQAEADYTDEVDSPSSES